MQRLVDIKRFIQEKKLSGSREEMAEKIQAHFEEKGIIKLPLGSFWRYMHADWFALAIEERVLSENVYGMFVPLYNVLEDQEEVGRKGREIIYKTVKRADGARFDNFRQRYEKFLYAQEMEEQSLKQLAQQNDGKDKVQAQVW